MDRAIGLLQDIILLYLPCWGFADGKIIIILKGKC